MSQRGTAHWLAFRLLPGLFLCSLVAILSGLFRAQVCALPGLAGMVGGSLAGYGTGRLGRGDGPRLWDFGQRIWLTLAGAVVYVWGQLLVAGALHASPADSLFYWIAEMADGLMAEPFFSVGQTGGVLLRFYGGTLSGGWWIFFNALDGLLFALLFLVLLGMGLSPQGDDGPEETEGPDELDDGRKRGSSPAFRGFIALVVVLAGTSCLAWHLLEGSGGGTLLPFRGQQGLEPLLAERWRFDGAKGPFSSDGGGGELLLRPSGRGALEGFFEGDSSFRLSLYRRGRGFRGLLWPLDPSREGAAFGRPLSVRLRFTPDGRKLHMALALFSTRGRRDLLLEASPIDPAPPFP